MFTSTVAMLILASTASLADGGHYTATLVQPIAAKKEVIANGNVWRCDASICVLASTPKDADSLGTCRELRREVGVLSAFGREEKPFDADKLAKCNTK